MNTDNWLASGGMEMKDLKKIEGIENADRKGWNVEFTPLYLMINLRIRPGHQNKGLWAAFAM